jgi:tricorn protease-like protein
MKTFFLVMGALAVPAAFAANTSLHLLHDPAMNRTQIIFSYAGDLWTVGRQGGNATRLTSGAGIEDHPVFSPDGETIAFTGEYDGNVDVYTMPATGGVPRRITNHPGADYPVGWTPDGKRILLRSNRQSFSRYTQLFTITPGQGLPTALPLPMAFSGSYSPDGQRMVYAPLDGGQFGRTPARWVAWNRYRGGEASYLWIINFADLSVEKIQRTDSNDINPMWVGNSELTDTCYNKVANASSPLLSRPLCPRLVERTGKGRFLYPRTAEATAAICYRKWYLGRQGVYRRRNGQTERPLRLRRDALVSAP